MPACVLPGRMNGLRDAPPVWSCRPSDSPGRPAVHPAAGEHRRHHLGVADPLRVGDDVGVEHDQVGLQARQQAAAAPLLADRVGSRGGEAGDRVGDRDPLLRVPRLAARRGCGGRRRACRPAGRAARSEGRRRTRRVRPSRAARGCGRPWPPARPRSRPARSRSEVACTGCIEAITPSAAKRGRSASSRHCTCSMRGRSSASLPQRRAVRSNAFRAARLAPSPIACAATDRPPAVASVIAVASSSSDSSGWPEPSSIHAVCEPSVPSMNAFTGPKRSSSLPKPVRISTARAAARSSSCTLISTRRVSRRSAS